jgi:nucleotide-binding universal stress UspA family protein
MLCWYPAHERGGNERSIPMKTILIATDGSEPAGQALEVAIELARQTGAALHVLSVRPQRVAGRGGAGPAIIEVEELDGPEHIADAAAARAREAGITATPHAAHGDVVNSIASAATSLGADLLVVGSRGHGPISGAVLGSVSHALVSRSPVPVTIVRHAAVHAVA